VAGRRWIPITATAALLAVLGGMVMQWSGMPLAPRRPAAPVALQQPVLVEPKPATPLEAARARSQTPDASLMAGGQEVTDSLFDHSEDVEFILDPVTLRKGRAHTVVRLQPEPARGQQAVITF
jgi:hypothetical protein